MLLTVTPICVGRNLVAFVERRRQAEESRVGNQDARTTNRNEQKEKGLSGEGRGEERKPSLRHHRGWFVWAEMDGSAGMIVVLPCSSESGQQGLRGAVAALRQGPGPCEQDKVKH